MRFCSVFIKILTPIHAILEHRSFMPHLRKASSGRSTLQGLLRSVLDESNDRSAKEIPDTVYLMNHVSCPAILVECGFMSNGEEVSLLLTHGYQTKIATALAVACVQYLRQ